MNSSDFNIDGLARYLGMHRDDVQRLADRGKLPGRRVGGGWRFRAPEIHRWVEAQIGEANEVQLRAAEARWKDVPAGGMPAPLLSGLLTANLVDLELSARTRSSAIRKMVGLAGTSGLLWDVRRMEEAVRQREDQHSTALANGVALLHPSQPMKGILAAPFLALGRTTQGIPFGGPGGSLTTLFLLICSINETQHLYTLARISRLITASGFMDMVRAATDPGSVIEWIQAWETTEHDA